MTEDNRKHRVLLALAQGEATAPQIRDRIQERHGKLWGFFAPRLGPINGTVRKLERDGLVTHREVMDGDIPVRGGYPHYYWRLTNRAPLERQRDDQ